MNETSQSSQTISCPTCGELVQSDHQTFPFCTKRCKMIDLNRWLSGDYRISRTIQDDDDLSGLETESGD